MSAQVKLVDVTPGRLHAMLLRIETRADVEADVRRDACQARQILTAARDRAERAARRVASLRGNRYAARMRGDRGTALDDAVMAEGAAARHLERVAFDVGRTLTGWTGHY